MRKKNRVAAGVPSGGRFAPEKRAEGLFRLEMLKCEPDPDGPTRSIGFLSGFDTVMDWDTKKAVELKTLTDRELENLSRLSEQSGQPISRDLRRLMNRRSRTGPVAAAEKVVDEITETGEAISGMAAHLTGIHTGGVKAPETKGNFVGWTDMLPKFLRRK